MREGRDVTIVSYSIGVGLALEAAETLAAEGIEAEVLDLRTLRPLDREAVLTSLAKTNRLVVAEEGWPVCGIASEIIALCMEEGFDHLDAPVLRVCNEDVPLPYAANLEKLALIDAAADRMGVPKSELVASDSRITHAKTGKVLRYGELAEAAARQDLVSEPQLKTRDRYTFIGKPIDRFDIPAKVNGTAQYGIDFALPQMRVATVIAAPVRGGTLQSVDHAPAMAVKGVEKVIALDNAVVVVASGYWPALKGARALAPKFGDAGHGGLSSASIYAAQGQLIAAGKPDNHYTTGDAAKVLGAPGAKAIRAEYRVPFLHQAAMEPFAMTGYHADGRLEVWGGTQDPIQTRNLLAQFSGLPVDKVTFHPMIMGGGFGRRFPPYTQIIEQIARVAMQVDHPVKIIWSREEDVKQGAYRPQSLGQLQAALGADGRIAAWQTDYAQFADAESETVFPYTVPATARRHYKYISNQVDAYWRSVNSTQHGFYNESFMDELAHHAGQDPYQFRRAHLPAGGRHLAVLDAVAKRSNWGAPLPAGTGRGIALVESFGTICAHVIEAGLKPDGTPQVHKVWAVIDCGTTVNPKNAEAQVQGGVLMGLSTALGEAITITNGAVDQNSFPDYPILKLADAPPVDVHFIESDAPIGGLGEPGLPPAAPALANALFMATGKRIRTLPIARQLA